jgi:iron complex outermembrane receptor protein
MPDTKISLSVDYFDIRVSDEITQLGAGNILRGCYGSLDFANEPLCDLFTRGQTAAPFNVANVKDKFVNIASQRNSGIDVAANIRQDLGNLGSISVTADMTWQLKDDLILLPGSPGTSTNGEAGSPKWVGDFRVNWQSPSSQTSLFYGINVIGATSNVEDFLDSNGGNPCINSSVYGTYCPKVTTPMTFYHNLSLTQEIGEKFDITIGMSNIFDTRPPRVSVLNGSQISTLGPVVAASQYPFVGRRVFMNVSAKF